MVRALEEYDWRGNIRELKNVVERAVYRSEGGLIKEVVFDPFISPYQGPSATRSESAQKIVSTPLPVTGAGDLTLKQALAELEKDLLHQALTACRHNQRKAAQRLGLTYDQFRGKLRKYDKAVVVHEEEQK